MFSFEILLFRQKANIVFFFQKTIGIKKEIIFKKKKYKCYFEINKREQNIDMKKSKVSCKPKAKKAIRIKEIELEKDSSIFLGKPLKYKNP